MAISDEIREQRRSLKGQGPKAYLQYFWDYYRYQTLAVIFFGGILISLVYNFVTAKPAVLSVTFMNAAVGMDTDQVSETIGKQFLEYEGLSASDGEVTVYLNHTIQPGTHGEYVNYTTTTSIMTFLGAGALDVIVANADNYEYYQGGGAFADLRTYFTEEELAEFGDNLYYIDYAEVLRLESEQEQAIENGESLISETEAEPEEAAAAQRLENYVRPDPADMEDPIPVGVYVEDASYIEGLGFYSDTVVIAGIISGTKNSEAAADFLQFLISETYYEAL